jgi:hypothetical protein
MGACLCRDTRGVAMLGNLGEFWSGVRQSVTQWSIAGAVLLLTGVAPEQWFRELFRTLRLSGDGQLQIGGLQIDLRLLIVALGFVIIVADVVLRSRRKAVAPTANVQPAPVAPPRAVEPQPRIEAPAPVGGPPEYYCYISRSKIEDILAASETAPQAVGLAQVATLADAELSYGRPDMLQTKAGRQTAGLLREALRHIQGHVVPFSFGDASIAAGSFCWAKLSMRVREFDADRGNAQLIASAPSGDLLLDCSLNNFSGRDLKDGVWRPNSTNFSFFERGTAMTFETVFIVTARESNQISGSPLFLKLPVGAGVYL